MDMGEFCGDCVLKCVLLGPVPLTIQACSQDPTTLGS